MDLYIMRFKNPHTINEISEELLYARKFWRLLEAKFVKGYQDNCFVKAPICNKEDMNELIKLAIEEPDYWGEYTTVPILCQIRDEIEERIEEGWRYYLMADW